MFPPVDNSNIRFNYGLRSWYWALICYLHNPKIFFLEIPQGPLGISIGNIRSAQKAFRVPQSSVFCHFPCFVEISPKNGICSQNRIFWPIFKCHTILESYRQHGRRATLQVKIRGLNKELLAIQEKNLTFYTGCPIALGPLCFFAILSDSTIPKYKNLVIGKKFRKFAIR